MTPQLQQAIRLLQLSSLELEQELETILADNPLLERIDDPLQDSLRIAANGSIEAEASISRVDTDDRLNADPRDSANDAVQDNAFELNNDFESGLDSDWGYEASSRTPNDDNDEARTLNQIADTGRSLRDHLLGQLAATRCEPLDRAIVMILIENLDEDGYLDASLEEIAACLPDEVQIEPESLTTGLKLLQSFDPTGIGARDLQESLRLQLRARPERDSSLNHEALGLAIQIVDEHLPLLAAKDYTRLKRALHCDEDALREAQALIRSLNPRPGAAFSVSEPVYVIPDVVVRKVRGSWQVQLNSKAQPQLKVNDVYAQIVRSSRGSGGENLSSQLQEARWLIKNLQQRALTIERVAGAIVERQKTFFSHGAVAMRPLVLREIAEELGLHESTISRVTTQKYMLTPHGTFELKYFFGSHVATEAGGTASSTAIRELIKQLVDVEDPRTPLSDGRLAELLGERGIVVARRTVAKYREASRIPAVSQRKVL